MKKTSVIYNWLGIFSVGILILYLEYIRYTQDENLLFPGEPPFHTADSDFTFVVSPAIFLSNLCFFAALLNLLLLIFRRQNKLPGFYSSKLPYAAILLFEAAAAGLLSNLCFFAALLNLLLLIFRRQNKLPGFYSSKLPYAAILLFEAAAAGLALYQLITYGSWTVCEAGLNTPLGKFSPLYLPAVIMAAAVLIFGIAQFFHERKRWQSGFCPQSERNRLQTEQAQNAANKESAVQTPGFDMNRKTALYSLIGVIICGAATVYGAFFDYRFQNLLLFSGEGPYQWSRDAHTEAALYSLIGVIICGAATVYGAFFDYRFQNLLLFSGEGPYQWSRDAHTEATVPFIVLSNLALLLLILNGLLLFFYKTKKHPGFCTGKKTYYIMLAAEILLAAESVYRVIRYFSWTVAEIRTPGINTWYDGIMPIAPTLIPVLIFALALLILGILQFLSAKKNTSVF